MQVVDSCSFDRRPCTKILIENVRKSPLRENLCQKSYYSNYNELLHFLVMFIKRTCNKCVAMMMTVTVIVMIIVIIILIITQQLFFSILPPVTAAKLGDEQHRRVDKDRPTSAAAAALCRGRFGCKQHRHRRSTSAGTFLFYSSHVGGGNQSAEDSAAAEYIADDAGAAVSRRHQSGHSDWLRLCRCCHSNDRRRYRREQQR